MKENAHGKKNKEMGKNPVVLFDDDSSRDRIRQRKYNDCHADRCISAGIYSVSPNGGNIDAGCVFCDR